MSSGLSVGTSRPVGSLDFLLISSVTLGKLLNFCVVQFYLLEHSWLKSSTFNAYL